ncbi:MAG: hypothetical protein ACR2GY_10360 [Phycisphaerales bacterium]
MKLNLLFATACSFLLASLLGFAADDPPATDPNAPTTLAADDAATAPHLLSRIVCVGASATNGFMVSYRATDEATGRSQRMNIKMREIIRAGIDVAEPASSEEMTLEPKFADYSDLMFFLDSPRVGRRLWARTVKAQPTLIIAIDFLFWFSYGDRNAASEPLRSEEERLALLDLGLDLLASANCRVIVGDVPDMSAAVGGMLSRAQMPENQTLERVNQRIHEWAKTQPHITVVPLADLIAKMNSNEEIVIGRYTWPAGSRDRLIQPDELHPTLDGMIALAQMVANAIEDLGVDLQPATLNLDPAHVRSRLDASGQ